jgi:hypothetical protein
MSVWSQRSPFSLFVVFLGSKLLVVSVILDLGFLVWFRNIFCIERDGEWVFSLDRDGKHLFGGYITWNIPFAR